MVQTEKICSVIECNEAAVRSISSSRVSKTGMNVERTRRVQLCSIHYKEFKKKSRNFRKVEQWRYNV